MATWVNLIDVVYPIGSMYFSATSTSPASTVGGTWSQIKGALIAATGNNGFASVNYGGSLKISVSQMPTHAHAIHAFSPQDNNVSGNNYNPTTGDWLAFWGSNDGHSTVAAGGNAAHNNMPAYQTLYAWRRTA